MAWLALSLVLTLFAVRMLASPGLYYDEAIFAGLARDFVRGSAGPHMPNTTVVNVFGRPFPFYVQNYLGGLKAWLILPGFAVFGSSQAVLRLSALFWSLIGLLFFMLAARRLLGLWGAMIAGLLLALDPAWFFLSVLDWGAVVPSFLCRLAGCYFFLVWAKSKKLRYGVLAAILFGLGVFNKIDFAVLFVGCALALVLVDRQTVRSALRNSRKQVVACVLIFLLTISPMFIFVLDIFGEAFGNRGAERGSEFREKMNTLCAMYDGSYVNRLMEVGGKFDRMFAGPGEVWGPFGLVVLVGTSIVGAYAFRANGATARGRLASFLVLSLVLITLGVFLLPGAVRMHHSTLVYPFPHLIVAAAVVLLWQMSPGPSSLKWATRACAIGLLGAAVVGNVNAIWQTQRLIESTGGRGWWSNSLETFCDDVKGQTGRQIVSLDWGFDEQVCFLTDDKNLSEPFWSGQPSLIPGAIYLVHPREYALFPQGLELLDFATRNPERGFSIRPYKDRQGNIAFYAIAYQPAKGR